jgi:hypothetical protein
MKTRFFKFGTLFLTALLIISTGCKKEDADAQSAEDAARGSYIMADAFSIANDAQGGKLNKRFSVDCFTIDAFEGGFTITFFECTDEYGVYRDGSITVTATQDAWSSGSTAVITITFDNYVQDNEGISGTISARAGEGALGVYFTLTATNLRLTYSNGEFALINSAELTWTFTLTGGMQYNGHSDGVTRHGVTYSSVSENLVFGYCSWPVSGIMTIDVEGENEITINFDQNGEAPCDNIYLVTQKRHRDVQGSF